MSGVCVVAPHPDDDVLGCGQFLQRAFAQGDFVRVLYVTDGAASHPQSRAYPPDRLARLRASEACDAIERLGGTRDALAFLGVPDGTVGTLRPHARALVVSRIAAFLKADRPATVCLPWRRDPHPDHVAVSAIARDALAAAACSARVFEYPVWLGVRGGDVDVPHAGEVRTVSFDAGAGERERKRFALLAHRSQTTALIDDDPAGFVMSPELIDRFCAQPEVFFEGGG